MDLADAKVTYFAGTDQPSFGQGSGHGPVLQTLLNLRDQCLDATSAADGDTAAGLTAVVLTL